MASGTINSPYVVETIAATKNTTKIPSGDYVFRVRRCGNVVEISGWFHNTTQINDGDTLFTFPNLGLTGVGGFCVVTKETNIGSCEYGNTSFKARSTLAVGYWNISTVHIFAS